MSRFWTSENAPRHDRSGGRLQPALIPALFGLCVGLSPFATAQTPTDAYPNRPIRMIAPSSAGGPVDIIARIFAQGLTAALGQQIVIDNRPGAAGLIGTEQAAKAPSDGYTLLFGFSGPLAIVPNLNHATPYSVLQDFAPVSLVASAPYVLLVHPGVSANSVPELLALARARPGRLNYASGGNGSGIHMAGELFNLAGGVQIVHVPYKGAGPGMAALLAGEVDMMFNGLAPALPYIRSGKLRALAVSSDQRSALAPDLPTIAESGLRFNTSGWYGLLAPRGTPPSVIGKLHGETVRTLNLPAVREQLAKLAVEGVGSTPEQFSALMQEELATWAKVTKAAGLQDK